MTHKYKFYQWPEMPWRKRKRLEDEGWKFGTAKEFLQLTDEEVKLIEDRLDKERDKELGE